MLRRLGVRARPARGGGGASVAVLPGATLRHAGRRARGSGRRIQIAVTPHEHSSSRNRRRRRRRRRRGARRRCSRRSARASALGGARRRASRAWRAKPARPTRLTLAPFDLGDLDGTRRASAIPADVRRHAPHRRRGSGAPAAAAVVAVIVAAAGYVLLPARQTAHVRRCSGRRPAATGVSRSSCCRCGTVSRRASSSSPGSCRTRARAPPLSSVIATAFLFDAGGTFLASGRAPLDFSHAGAGGRVAVRAVRSGHRCRRTVSHRLPRGGRARDRPRRSTRGGDARAMTGGMKVNPGSNHASSARLIAVALAVRHGRWSPHCVAAVPRPQAAAQQRAEERQSFRFRTGVELINVTATVTDASGRFVSGLRKEDFRLFEDDQPQEITHFNSERVPVSLGIAIDTSGSMDGEKMLAAREALSIASSSSCSDRTTRCFSIGSTRTPSSCTGWTTDRARARSRARPAVPARRHGDVRRRRRGGSARADAGSTRRRRWSSSPTATTRAAGPISVAEADDSRERGARLRGGDRQRLAADELWRAQPGGVAVPPRQPPRLPIPLPFPMPGRRRPRRRQGTIGSATPPQQPRSYGRGSTNGSTSPRCGTSRTTAAGGRRSSATRAISIRRPPASPTS